MDNHIVLPGPGAKHPIQHHVDAIDARFVSGNSVPVERVRITDAEWHYLRKVLLAALVKGV